MLLCIFLFTCPHHLQADPSLLSSQMHSELTAGTQILTQTTGPVTSRLSFGSESHGWHSWWHSLRLLLWLHSSAPSLISCRDTCDNASLRGGVNMNGWKEGNGEKMRQERWEQEEIGEGRLFWLLQPTGSMSHTHLIQYHTDDSASPQPSHCNCFYF